MEAARVAQDERALGPGERRDLLGRHAPRHVFVGNAAVAHRHPRPYRVVTSAGLAARHVLEWAVAHVDVREVDERLQEVLVVEVDVPVLRCDALVRGRLLGRVPEVDVRELRPEPQVGVRDVEDPPRGAEGEPGVVRPEDDALEAVRANDELLARPDLPAPSLRQRPFGLGDERGALRFDRVPLLRAGQVCERQGHVSVPVERVDDPALGLVQLHLLGREPSPRAAVAEQPLVQLVGRHDAAPLDRRGDTGCALRELRLLAMHRRRLPG